MIILGIDIGLGSRRSRHAPMNGYPEWDFASDTLTAIRPAGTRPRESYG
jgi:hypothetical protein